jgi:hypothetical protein
MLSAMNDTASSRFSDAPTSPMSAAEISTAPRRRASRDAVSAATQPPMLWPLTTRRVVSIDSARAFAVSRRKASTAPASSTLLSNRKAPGLPHDPR